ncbi:DNA primase large subunit-like [Nymphalis io]|uniref:DNA primase large subunit-like n=1 Tax=Inachis io TaxID=171585 RepID=UPI002169288E|nr:DNA primase large subunit-like [Nymphalis io]
MSFFYLSPVKGDLQIYLLETIVIKRLEFLKTVFKRQNIAYNEYVVEGSVYDVVGHYMLCIIVILENNSEFTQFFIKAEESLFRHRLETLSAYDLRCFAKKLLRIIKKHPTNLHFLDSLSSLCQHLILKHVAQHFCSDACAESCSLHSIKVHFKDCLTFIAKRQVEVQNGIAYIPCSKWKIYLILLFKDNLRNRLAKTNLHSLQNDPRIADIVRLVRKEILTLNKPNNNILRSNEVDDFSKLFPPCMLNLHQNLRNKHRLSHNQRFSYSLFLKDIGMPVDEAVTFWRIEYEQVPNGKHKCCHSWKNDEKKFIYGIRHLYGLEGGKKMYSSGSCLRLQGFTEGGCPFKSFDNEAMLQLLDIKENDPSLSQIKKLQAQSQYTSACVLYLKKRFLSVSNSFCDSSFNFSPVKYYFATKYKNS